MSRYLLKEHLDKVAESNSYSIVNKIKNDSDENYERLLYLLSVDTTSSKIDSFSHAKIVAFLCTVMSNPELTDKFIIAISSYNDKEALGVLDG